MTTVRSAFYARVSSEQQAAAHTIESVKGGAKLDQCGGVKVDQLNM